MPYLRDEFSILRSVQKITARHEVRGLDVAGWCTRYVPFSSLSWLDAYHGLRSSLRTKLCVHYLSPQLLQRLRPRRQNGPRSQRLVLVEVVAVVGSNDALTHCAVSKFDDSLF